MRSETTRTINPWATLAAALCVAGVLLAPNLAYAQAVTGGNGGFIAPILQWFMTNFSGVILMFMRLHLAGLVTMIVGSLIVTNYQALAALL